MPIFLPVLDHFCGLFVIHSKYFLFSEFFSCFPLASLFITVLQELAVALKLYFKWARFYITIGFFDLNKDLNCYILGENFSPKLQAQPQHYKCCPNVLQKYKNVMSTKTFVFRGHVKYLYIMSIRYMIWVTLIAISCKTVC